jgi:uncharacterized protein
MNVASQLLVLQEADSGIAQLRSEVAALEARLRGDPRLDRARADSSGAAEERRRADEAVSDADREVVTLQERAKQINKQLYGGTVRNPQDLLTLQRELDDVRARLASAEEQELALMEAAEAAEAGQRSAMAAVEKIEAERAAAAGPETERLERARVALEQRQARREEIAASVPAQQLALYRRLSGRLQPAVVRLSGEHCGGCRIALGIAEVHAVRAGDVLVQCPNCDRILAR